MTVQIGSRARPAHGATAQAEEWVAPVGPPVPPVGPPVAPSSTAPAVQPPTWSGRKTAIAAALAIGFASVGAAGASALPTQTVQSDDPTGQTGPGGGIGRGFGGQHSPGRGGNGGQVPQTGPNQQSPGQQFPGQQFPGQQLPGQQLPGQQFPSQQFPGQQPPDQPGQPDQTTGGTVRTT